MRISYMLKPIIALLITIFLWASAFVGIRYSLSVYTPGALALFRFILASLMMGILYPFFSPAEKMPFKDAAQLLLIGIAGIGIYNVCLNYGEITVSAGIASFLIGQIPIFTLILSFFLLKEPVQLKILPGIAVSFLGITLMAFGEHGNFHLNGGVVIILISALMGALYTISQRKYLQKYHPVTITAWVIWGGTLMLSVFSYDLWKQLPTSTRAVNITLLYLGIFPAAIAYVAWCYVLRYMTATRASMFLYTMPIFSTFLGFILLHEQPTPWALWGGILAMGGALFTNILQKKTAKFATVKR